MVKVGGFNEALKQGKQLQHHRYRAARCRWSRSHLDLLRCSTRRYYEGHAVSYPSPRSTSRHAKQLTPITGPIRRSPSARTTGARSSRIRMEHRARMQADKPNSEGVGSELRALVHRDGGLLGHHVYQHFDITRFAKSRDQLVGSSSGFRARRPTPSSRSSSPARPRSHSRTCSSPKMHRGSRNVASAVQESRRGDSLAAMSTPRSAPISRRTHRSGQRLQQHLSKEGELPHGRRNCGSINRHLSVWLLDVSVHPHLQSGLLGQSSASCCATISHTKRTLSVPDPMRSTASTSFTSGSTCSLFASSACARGIGRLLGETVGSAE